MLPVLSYIYSQNPKRSTRTNLKLPIYDLGFTQKNNNKKKPRCFNTDVTKVIDCISICGLVTIQRSTNGPLLSRHKAWEIPNMCLACTLHRSASSAGRFCNGSTTEVKLNRKTVSHKSGLKFLAWFKKKQKNNNHQLSMTTSHDCI